MIQAAIDNGQVVGFATCEQHEVAGTLKQWLQALPEPLIPFRSLTAFVKNGLFFLIQIHTRNDTHNHKLRGHSHTQTADAAPEVLKKLVEGLPPLNRRCLHKLMDLLHIVAQHSDKNKMSEGNLAVVFAPTLLKEKSGVSSLETHDILARVLSNMLRNYDTVFGPFSV